MPRREETGTSRTQDALLAILVDRLDADAVERMFAAPDPFDWITRAARAYAREQERLGRREDTRGRRDRTAYMRAYQAKRRARAAGGDA